MDKIQKPDFDHSSSHAEGQMAAPGIQSVDVKAVNKAEQRQLYKPHETVYPKRVRGRFRLTKAVVMIVMFVVYYSLPWLRWDRGPGVPDQAVLIDFTGTRFYFFFIEIWPQEIYFITGLLILAAIGLFLITAMFGRLWCGFACPQTVWTDLFIAVERRIEGDRTQRIRLAKAPWTYDKITKKLLKHVVWIVIALSTGGAWIMYFHDAPSLARDLIPLRAPLSAYIFMGLLGGFTYLLGGFAREQVCTYMCPWPRIQGAMFDDDTLIVSYERDRGEQRGPHKKGDSWEDRGHCIDCKQCVVVCPMGIDIRDGAQLECIGCGLCIDACNGIMKKLDLEPNLIAFDTDKNIERRQKGEPTSFRLIRPRTLGYALILLVVSAIMVFALINRSVLELNIQRDRNPLFVTLSDGSIRNGYTIKILNKQQQPRVFNLTLDAPLPLAIKVVGLEGSAQGIKIPVASDTLRALRVFVTKPAGTETKTKFPITFTVTDSPNEISATYEGVFIGGIQ